MLCGRRALPERKNALASTRILAVAKNKSVENYSKKLRIGIHWSAEFKNIVVRGT